MATDMTIGQVIDSTREHLLGNGRSEMNLVASTMSGTSATVATTYPLGGITPGTMIGIGDEEMYVFATNPGGLTATVSRGENSTTPQIHAPGTRIYVNEPFTRSMIVNAVVDDIRSWGPQLYSVQSLDITTIPYQTGYDLGDINPYYGILDVYLTPYPTYVTMDNLDWKRVRFRDFQQAPTSDFPSGNALIITDVGGMQGGQIPNWNVNGLSMTLHVIYATAFNVDKVDPTSATVEGIKLASDVGLDETEFDIPAMGAAWRLMLGREARRATTLMQGEPRSENEVPPLYISKTAEYFKSLRDGRLNDAQTRLMRMYPLRTSN
jgi:hypothetical protein